MDANHYENFPVASILLPKRLRKAVKVIYSFARQADDHADEGSSGNEERLAALNSFRDQLDRISENKPPLTTLFRDLTEVVAHHQLPLQPLYDLLDAFSQDVLKKRYANFQEVLDYCDRSANPIGRLLLHLYGEASPSNIAYSDAICTGLQLTNFWQDIARDYAIGRIYIPQDEMANFGVNEQHISQKIVDDAWRKLMLFQVQRTRDIMRSGAPLGSILTGRVGLEMRLIIAGGNRILDKLEIARFNMLHQRPILGKLDWVMMLTKIAPFRF